MKQHENLSGISLMIQASIAFSVMALCVKWASRTLPILELVFFRSLIGTIVIAAVIRAKRISFWGEEKGLMALRGLSGFLALTLNFITIAHMPLGTAMLLNYTGPIFATILAVLFLKERPGFLQMALILISFAGVALLLDVRHVPLNALFLTGLLSAVFLGIVYVSIRALRHSESPYTIIFYFTGVSTLGSLFFIPFGFKWPGLTEWLLIGVIGIGSFFGQLYFTLSIQKAPASVVGPFSYLTPLLSYLSGLFFFGEALTPLSLAGACLIIFSGSFLTYIEARNQNPNLA
jgi:drug/metabolite transporter (DMT)-like permease